MSALFDAPERVSFYDSEWISKYPSDWSRLIVDYSFIYGSDLAESAVDVSRTTVADFSDWFVDRLKGRTLVDLGAGNSVRTTYGLAAKCGCSELVRVDPNYSSESRRLICGDEFRQSCGIDGRMIVRSIPSDALHYLRKQDDCSHVVMANGLFNEPFQRAYMPQHFPLEDSKKWIRYVRDLMREIYRVTPTLFFGNGTHRVAKSWCIASGFRELDLFCSKNSMHKSLDDMFNADTPMMNQVFLFEK